MIFDNRNYKQINHYTDCDREFGQFSRGCGLHGSDDGNSVLIKKNGTVFMAIARAEYDETISRHKTALISNSVYTWNNYAIYGWLQEKGLISSYMKFNQPAATY